MGKRSHGDGCVYLDRSSKRRKPWAVQITTAGRRITLGHYTTRGEANRARRQAVAAADLGERVRADRITIEVLANRWLTARNVRETTRKNYARYLRCHILPALGQITACQLTSERVEQFISEIPLCRNSVILAANVLRQVLEFGVKNGYLTRNVAADCNAGKGIASTRRALSDSELLSLWQALPSDSYGNACKFAVLTGCRLSEIRGLTWDRVSPDSIIIDRQYYDHAFHPTKSGRPRTIPVFPLLESLLQSQRCASINDFVFSGVNGPFGKTVLESRLKNYLSAAGIDKPFTFHGLRHTYACLASEVMDIKTVQENLGHADLSTISTYLHSTRESLARNADCLQRKMDSVLHSV